MVFSGKCTQSYSCAFLRSITTHRGLCLPVVDAPPPPLLLRPLCIMNPSRTLESMNLHLRLSDTSELRRTWLLFRHTHAVVGRPSLRFLIEYCTRRRKSDQAGTPFGTHSLSSYALRREARRAKFCPVAP